MLPDGWTEDYDSDDEAVYRHTDGREQNEHPGRLEGVIALTDAIKNNGALTSINVLKNKIPVEQAQALVEIMRSKDLLTTLCGLSGKEIELDWSNQGLGAGDAVLIANDIKTHLALSSVNMLNNGIGVEQANVLVDIMKSKSKDNGR